MRKLGTAAAAGRILTLGGLLALLVSLCLPWYAYGALPDSAGEPGGREVKAAIAVLFAAIALLTLLAPAGGPRGTGLVRTTRRALPVLLALGLLALVVLQLDGFARIWPVHPGGWLAAFTALTIVLGTLCAALAPRSADVTASRVGTWVSSAAVIVVLALVATLIGVSGADTTVQANTASTLPVLSTLTPADPTRVLWSDALGENEAVAGAFERYVVVEQADGVRVLDAETGQQRWRYLRRTDEYELDYAVLSSDGATVYAIFRSTSNSDAITVDAFETATGSVLRQWTTTVDTATDDWREPNARVVPTWFATGGELVHVLQTEGAVIAVGFDAQTGAQRWKHEWLTPVISGNLQQTTCSPGAQVPAASADGVLAVIAECQAQPNATVFQAISEVDGRTLWSDDISANRDPAVYAVAGLGFLVADLSANKQQLISAADGHDLTSFNANTNVYGGQQPLAVIADGTTASVAGLSPTDGSTLWTASIALTGGSTQDVPTMTTDCSGRTYVLTEDAGSIQLFSRADAGGGSPATVGESALAMADPNVFACAPGELLIESSSINTSDPTNGEVLYALG
jgi:hypothetical protein